MALRIRKAVVVYVSPAGSTGHVARVILERVRFHEVPAVTIDLGEDPDIRFIMTQLPDAKDNMCLYIGSPVYANHPVPIVLEFISTLPRAEEGYAVPFVTWGGVTSGIALHEMAAGLENRGYRVLGAAKVVAEHSLMWASDNPLGAGRPDAGDDRMVAELADGVHAKLRAARPEPLSVSALAYQPPGVRTVMEKTSLDDSRARLPVKELHQGRCTRCGLCAEACPADAIAMTPFPEFSNDCILCFTCVRRCPENAIVADMSPVFDRLRARARELNEQPLTEVFL